MIGARPGAFSWLRQLVARAMADELSALVVPDARLARDAGLDLAAAGLRPAATARHASVLLLVGPIPGGLASAAAVAYAQMPRPRAILAAGAGTVAELPTPDVAVALDQSALVAGVADLRRRFRTSAFAAGAVPFAPKATATRREYVCPMHPEVVRDAPGSCPTCGMDLVPREAAGAASASPPGHDDAAVVKAMAATDESPAPAPASADFACPMHPDVTSDQPGSCPKCGMRLEPRAPEPEAAPAEPAATTRPVGDASIDGPATYACPMHPEIVRPAPGRCPLCGMFLTPVAALADANPGSANGPVAHGDAGDHAHHHGVASSTDAAAERAARIVHRHAPHTPAAADPAARRPRLRDDRGRDPAAALPDAAIDAHPDHATAFGSRGDADAASMAGTMPMDRHRAADFGGHEGNLGHPTMGETEAAGSAMDHAGMTRGMPAAPEEAAALPMDHAAMGHGMPAGAEVAVDHAAIGHAMPMEHDVIANGGMDHGAMGHDMSGGFMSMVAVTRDLPRSRDGLPMEWIDAAFGPLFPGLPGGLALTLTLDGDGIAGAAIAWGITRRGLEATWPGPAATFPDRLARLDPLAPAAYRRLGERAVAAAAGLAAADGGHAGVRAAERERVRSHLGWLAEFARLLGDEALTQRAAALHLAAAGARDPHLADIDREARALVDAVRRDRPLRTRLRGIGSLRNADPPAAGPVARAGGHAVDGRTDDPAYAGLGFAPATAAGDDALARLEVRLAEIVASFDLLGVLPGGDAAPLPAALVSSDWSGSGAAAVETPRGAARLRLTVERGAVVAAHLETPTDLNGALVSAVTDQADVADAQAAVASLDISPWEHDR